MKNKPFHCVWKTSKIAAFSTHAATREQARILAAIHSYLVSRSQTAFFFNIKEKSGLATRDYHQSTLSFAPSLYSLADILDNNCLQPLRVKLNL